MEASPQPEPEPAPLSRPGDHVFLDPEVVEIHLQTGQPIDGAKARMIYQINKLVDEFDPDFGPGIARNGEW